MSYFRSYRRETEHLLHCSRNESLAFFHCATVDDIDFALFHATTDHSEDSEPKRHGLLLLPIPISDVLHVKSWERPFLQWPRVFPDIIRVMCKGNAVEM